MSAKPLDYDALAKQHGGVVIDYDALAKAHGGESTDALQATSKPQVAPQPVQTPHTLRDQLLAWRSKVDQSLQPGNQAEDNVTGPISEAVNTIGKGVANYAVSPFLHPVAALKAVGDQMRTVANPMSSINPGSRYQQGIAETIEQAKKYPLYTASGLIGTALLSHGLVGEVPESPSAAFRLPESIRESIQNKFAPDVASKAVEKFGEESEQVRQNTAEQLKAEGEKRLKVKAENRAATQEHEQATQEAKEQTAANLKLANDRHRLETEITNESKKQDVAYQQAEQRAQTEENAKWAPVHAKNASATAPIAPLQQAAEFAIEQADPQHVALFNRIMKNSNEPPRPVHVSGFPNGVPTNDPNYATYYQMEYGEPPPVAGESGAIPFDQAHRWYNYVSKQLYGGNRDLPMGTKNGLRMVRKALDNAMQSMAEQTGSVDDLKAARQATVDRLEAFHDSPNEKSTVASKSLQEQTPEFEKEQARQERLEKVAKYDPSITSREKHISNMREALRKVPKEKPRRELITKPPESPELKPIPKPGEPPEAAKVPQVDQETREVLEKNLKKYGQTGAWVWRLIAGGVAKYAIHGGMGGEFAGDILLGQGALKLFTNVLRKDSVLDWLSKPTRETLEQIDKLPPEDAEKLRNSLTALAAEELRDGKATHIPIGAGQILGPKNLAALVTAVGAQGRQQLMNKGNKNVQ